MNKVKGWIRQRSRLSRSVCAQLYFSAKGGLLPKTKLASCYSEIESVSDGHAAEKLE
jgi:hypothetical protein